MFVRFDEAEITNEDRSKINDTVFQQMENEVGVVMAQVSVLNILWIDFLAGGGYSGPKGGGES